MILESRIAEGTRLPPERELAAALGVSRTSLRDALQQLELKGLIDRRPGRGTVIVGSQSRDLSGDLLAKLSGEERNLREVMDLRATIEPPVAARAAARATAQNIRRMRELQAEIESPVTSPERRTEMDVAFHNEIARATHNPLLVRLVETASEWFEPSRHLAVQTATRRKATIAAHRQILAAIEAHDSVAAELAMRDHLDAVNRFLRLSLDKQNGRKGR
jgi:DNA-binding FadR family transcriptional regulator